MKANAILNESVLRTGLADAHLGRWVWSEGMT
jgi:hypothetical protein